MKEFKVVKVWDDSRPLEEALNYWHEKGGWSFVQFVFHPSDVSFVIFERHKGSA